MTISYADLALPAWQRRRRLHDRYLFNCSCYVCRALCGPAAGGAGGPSDEQENNTNTNTSTNKNGRRWAREGEIERALDETKWGLACPRAAEGCVGWLRPWPQKRYTDIYLILYMICIYVLCYIIYNYIYMFCYI